MAQQPQAPSQYVFGPSGGGGDILHFVDNANVVRSWVDNNGAISGVSLQRTPFNGPAAALALGAAGAGVVANAAGTQLALNAPGASALEQVPFVVKVGGYISAAAGTYTATLQPLLYASTTVGFTAAAANAIFSAAAVTITMTQTAASVVPFELEAHLIGDSTSGKVLGWNQGQLPTTSTGTTLTTATSSPTIISNGPTSVTFSAAVPLQFAFGVTIAGTQSTGSVVNVGTFALSS